MLAAALTPLILAEMVATGGIKMRCDPRAVEFSYQVLRKWLQWQSVLTQDAGLSNLLEHGITFPSSLFLSQVTCIVSHLVGGVWIEGKVRFLDNPRRQSSLTTQDSGNRSLEIKEYTPVGWVRGEGHTPPRFSQEIWKALSKIEGCVCVCVREEASDERCMEGGRWEAEKQTPAPASSRGCQWWCRLQLRFSSLDALFPLVTTQS